jgi:hypothetical protein
MFEHIGKVARVEGVTVAEHNFCPNTAIMPKPGQLAGKNSAYC